MTQDVNDLEAELTHWCQSYVTAFSAYDAVAIAEHWAFPSLIIHEGGRAVFKTAEHFSKNTAMLLSFYERQGVARAERTLLSLQELGAGAVSMRVWDVMLDSASETITQWEAAYLLQRIDGNWRAVCAAADGEAAAWRSRGTPLGS